MQSYIISFVFFVILAGSPIPLCLLLLSLQKEKRGPSPSENLLAFISSWCIIQTATGLLLGICGCLAPWPLLTAELVLAAVGKILLRCRKSPGSTLSVGNLFMPRRPFDRTEAVVLLAILFAGFVFLWIALSVPVTDYDSLAYHMPAMAEWYQTGFLKMLTPSGQIGRYPYGWEVLCTLFMFPFRGDVAVTLPNFAAWLLLGLGVYVLSAQIGARRLYRLSAAALTLTVPLVLANINTMHVDIPFAAFFLAGLCLARFWIRTRSTYYLVLFVASLGMTAGIKISGLIYSALLLMILAAGLLKSVYLDKKPLGLSFKPYAAYVPFAVSGLLFCLLLGGFWYFRNLIDLGNPLGYVKIQLAGKTLLPGRLSSEMLYKTSLAYRFDLFEPAHWVVLAKQAVSKLWFSFFILLFSSAGYFFSMPRRRGQREQENKPKFESLIKLGFFGLLGITFLLYWTTPYSATNSYIGNRITPWIGQAFRYGFPFLGLLAVAAAGMNRVASRGTVAAVVLAAAVTGIFRAAMPFGISPMPLLLFLFIMLCAWGLHYTGPVPMGTYRIFLTWGLPAVLILTALAAPRYRPHNRKKHLGKGTHYIDTQVKPGQTIGKLCSPFGFKLYGPRLENKVIPLKFNRKIGRDQWIDSLRQRDVKYIVVGPLHQKRWRSCEKLKWVRMTDGPFRRVYGKKPLKEMVVYRLDYHRRPAKKPPPV